MSVACQAIEDCVCERRVAYCFVQMLHRQLACHDRRPMAMAILQDLQQVAAFHSGEHGQASA